VGNFSWCNEILNEKYIFAKPSYRFTIKEIQLGQLKSRVVKHVQEKVFYA